MDAFPLVSVIIPTYNRARLLKEAVGSVLRQSYSNYEILVVDDGSTDETPQWVKTLSDFICYLQFPHRGDLTFVRNQGLEAAGGELVAFLDSDDLWHSEKLARQVTLFVREPELGMVYTDAHFLDEDGILSEPKLLPYQKDNHHILANMLRSGFVHPSTVMVRKRLAEQLKGFDTRFGTQNDYHFFLRAAVNAPVQCLPEPLVHIRKAEGTMSKTGISAQFLDLAQALETFQTEEHLSFSHRVLIRRTISRLITHVGVEQRKNGQQRQARDFFRKSIWWNPFQFRAWKEYLITLGTE